MVKKPIKKKILILSFTDHYADPIVFRQTEALYNDFYVITAGTSSGTHQQTEHIQLTKIGILLLKKC